MVNKRKPAKGMTAAALFAAHARRLAREYGNQREQILSSDAPEATHRARVALRRMRSLVEGFSPVIATKAESRLSGRLRESFRALGPLRDADVRAASLAHTPEADEYAAAAAAPRRELRETLRREDGPGLSAEIRAMLEDSDFWRSSAHRRRLAEAPAAVIAQRALQIAWSDVLAYGDDLQVIDTETRHEFRKHTKTLRYLSEFFGPIWTGGRERDFTKRMAKLQDALGELNDLANVLHPEGGEVPAELAADLGRSEARAMKRAAKHWNKLREAGPWWHGSA